MEIPTPIAKKIIRHFEEEGRDTEYFTIRIWGKCIKWGTPADMEISLGYNWECGDGCCSNTEWCMNNREIEDFKFTEDQLKWFNENIKDESEVEFDYYP